MFDTFVFKSEKKREYINPVSPFFCFITLLKIDIYRIKFADYVYCKNDVRRKKNPFHTLYFATIIVKH